MSAIEWTGETLNTWTGCTKKDPACAHCYIERQPPMRIAGRRFVRGHIPLLFHLQRLDPVVRRRKPELYFVNSMSDTFHEDVPTRALVSLFGAMAAAPQHTFQVLTKRPERMQSLLVQPGFRRLVERERVRRLRELGRQDALDAGGDWPLPNVWCGVTIGNRRFVDRADVLRETPAAVRFISAEPLLGPVVADDVELLTGARLWADGYNGDELDLRGIGWLIVGGESGPRARPMREEWARDLIDAAVAVRCPSCMGEPVLRCTVCGNRDCYPSTEPGPAICTGDCSRALDDTPIPTEHVADPCEDCGGDGRGCRVFLKQLGGRVDKRGGARAVLDGRMWTEMPDVRVARAMIAP